MGARIRPESAPVILGRYYSGTVLLKEKGQPFEIENSCIQVRKEFNPIIIVLCVCSNAIILK